MNNMHIKFLNKLNQLLTTKVQKQIQKQMPSNQYSSNNNDIRKKIQNYSYGLNDHIGKGFSSIVYRGQNDQTNEKVAVKVINMKFIKDKIAKQMLDGQIDALRKLNHQNVMKCYDIFSTVNNCYIITEFCNEGDLENILKKRGKLSQQQAIPIFRDIFEGFKNIAESGFLHRDLKPANILLKDKVAKIADFGFAKRITSSSKQSANVGSPLYMSPQALKNNIYTIKNDIWSLGVLLYQMLHGNAPWSCSSQKQLIVKIQKNSIQFNKDLSPNIIDFIKCCLTPDESKRISLNEISDHAFIKKLSDNDIPKLLRRATTIEPKQVLQHPTSENSSANLKYKVQLIHHKNNPNSTSYKPQRQLTSQINWMRFLYKLNEMFPIANQSARYTLGLRFILVKQLFCQLNVLDESLKNRCNYFSGQDWSDIWNDNQRLVKYENTIEEYKKKYEKVKGDFKEWSKYVNKDKTLCSVVDQNFNRSQNLSILGCHFATQELKQLWKQLKNETIKLKQEELPENTNNLALRLDYITTYYQINCILVDEFNDSEHFVRNSKIDTIVEYKPSSLCRQNLHELQNKLKLLEIIK